jgi:hypothetical protein
MGASVSGPVVGTTNFEPAGSVSITGSGVGVGLLTTGSDVTLGITTGPAGITGMLAPPTPTVGSGEIVGGGADRVSTGIAGEVRGCSVPAGIPGPTGIPDARGVNGADMPDWCRGIGVIICGVYVFP